MGERYAEPAGAYIEIEEREGYEPGFNCEKSIIIKMTFDFIATITGGVEA